MFDIFKISQELWSCHPSKMAFTESGQDDARPDDLTGRFAFNGILRQLHQAVHGFHNPKTGNKVQGIKDRLDDAESTLAKARANDPEGVSWEVETAEATCEQLRVLWSGVNEMLQEGIAEYNDLYQEDWSPDMNSAPKASPETRAASKTKRQALLEAAGITLPTPINDTNAATGTDG